MVRVIVIVSLMLVGILGAAWAGATRGAVVEDATVAGPDGCMLYGTGSDRTITPGTPVDVIAPGAVSGMPYRANVTAWNVAVDGQEGLRYLGSLYLDCLVLSQVDQLRVQITVFEARIDVLEQTVAETQQVGADLQAQPQTIELQVPEPSSDLTSGTFAMTCESGSMTRVFVDESGAWLNLSFGLPGRPGMSLTNCTITPS